MIRHQLARILRAVADRLEVPVQPAPTAQYFYVYSNPTTWTWQTQPTAVPYQQWRITNGL